MDVRVVGHRASSAAQMVDGLIVFAELLERAAQVIARDAIQWVERDGGNKSIARVAKLAHLVIRHAKVDVRLDPIRGKFHHTLVVLNCLGEHFLPGLATESCLEELFRCGASH